jgi:hypothetical protein
MMVSTLASKSSILAQDRRFKSNATISPSPDAYRTRSFADLSLERGHSFSHTPKLLNRSKNHLFPGPTDHNSTYNP